MEDIDPNVQRCIIKKSKYYFKQELAYIVCILIGAILVGVVVCGLVWAGDNIGNVVIFLIVVMDIAIMGLMAWATANNSEDKIIKFMTTFFKLHAVFIAGLFIIFVEIICFFGIPICMFILGYLVSFWLTPDIWIALGIGCLVAIIVIPINFSMFICFKIDQYSDALIKRLGIWLL